MSDTKNNNLQKAFIKKAYTEYVREASKNRKDEIDYVHVPDEEKKDTVANANS